MSDLANASGALPLPVIGRIADRSFIVDFRSLEDVAAFTRNLGHLRMDGGY